MLPDHPSSELRPSSRTVLQILTPGKSSDLGVLEGSRGVELDHASHHPDGVDFTSGPSLALILLG